MEIKASLRLLKSVDTKAGFLFSLKLKLMDGFAITLHDRRFSAHFLPDLYLFCWYIFF